MNSTTVIAHAVASSPIFPPSFEGSPATFAAALFARLAIMMVSAAVIVRMMSQMRRLGGRVDNQTLTFQLTTLSWSWAFIFGSASDVVVWLTWGEVGTANMTRVMAASQMLNILTVGPFLCGLFVPSWMAFAIWIGIAREPADVAPPEPHSWTGMRERFHIVLLCLLLAVGVTLGKWMAWHGPYAG